MYFHGCASTAVIIEFEEVLFTRCIAIYTPGRRKDIFLEKSGEEN